MKKWIVLVSAILLCLTGTSAFADVYVSWSTYGDVYLASVRNAMESQFEAAGIHAFGSDSNSNQQFQFDFVATVLTTGDDAVVINLVESGAIGTARTMMEKIVASGMPTVWFNKTVSTDEQEAAELFLSNPDSAFVGTNFEDAGRMQGMMIGQYVLEHYDALDLNQDGMISYIMFKGDEANQEAIARTNLSVQYANEILTAAGKPEIMFYDENNDKKYLVDPNGTWSNTFSVEQMQTVLSMYNEGSGSMVELVICNNDDLAYGAVIALQNVGYNQGPGSTVIPVFGVDATDTARQLIADGAMTGTIKQDADGMADAVVTITDNMIHGRDKFDGLNESYVVVDNWFVQIPYAVYTGE